jgi:hypothetical protein
MSGSERGQYIKTQKQNKVQKRKDDHKSKAREIGWASGVFDLTIYAVVIGVITFLAPIVVAQLIERTVTYQQSLSPEKYAEETIKLSDEFEDMAAALQSQSPGTLVIIAIINGVGSAVSILVLCFLIHLLATKLMGGNGTLPFMMSQLVPYYSMLAPVFFVWWCILMGMVSIGAGLFAVLCSPFLGLGSFTILFKSAGRIGKAYDFGLVKGCLSLLAASFALSILGAVISTVILGTAINNVMTTMGLA